MSLFFHSLQFGPLYGFLGESNKNVLPRKCERGFSFSHVKSGPVVGSSQQLVPSGDRLGWLARLGSIQAKTTGPLGWGVMDFLVWRRGFPNRAVYQNHLGKA